MWAVELSRLVPEDWDKDDWIAVVAPALSAAVGAGAAILAAWLTGRHAANQEAQRQLDQLRALGARISIADGIVRSFVGWHRTVDLATDFKLMRMDQAGEEFVALARIIDAQLITLVRLPSSQLVPLLDVLSYSKLRMGEWQYVTDGRPLSVYAREASQFLDIFAGQCEKFLRLTEAINLQLAEANGDD